MHCFEGTLRSCILSRLYWIYAHFKASLETPDQAGQLSFPHFQAVMFAGAAWVDVKLVRKLGYLTRKAARKVLYQKARVRSINATMVEVCC